MKPFGCEVIVAKEEHERSNKVEPKGEVGMFLGVDGRHGDAGYKCLLSRRTRPKISSNVVFMLDVFPGWAASRRAVEPRAADPRATRCLRSTSRLQRCEWCPT